MFNWQHYSKTLPVGQFIVLNLALGFGHFMAVLSAGAFLPMLPYVAHTIERSIGFTVWGQSNYLAAMGLAFLIARPLMIRYGARNTAIAAYLLFALSCCDVLLSTPHYSSFVVARTLQGFAAGLSITPSLFLLLEHYQPIKQKFAIALWSLAAFTPFSVGPALGGYFAHVVGDWRILFVVFLVLSLLVAAVIWALTDRTVNQKDHAYPIYRHLLVFICLSIAILAFQSFFNVGIISLFNSHHFYFWLFSGIFLIAIVVVWFTNRLKTYPLLELSLFKYKNYSYGFILTCLAFMCIQGSIVQYIIRMQTIEGFSAWQVGTLFLPIFLFSKPLSIYTQHLIHRGTDPRLLASISFVGFAVSFWLISNYTLPTSWINLLWPQFLEGAALGIFFISMNSLTLGSVPQKLQLPAVDKLNAFRTISAGLAIAFTDIFWDMNAHHVQQTLLATYSNQLLTPQLLQHIEVQSGRITFSTTFQLLAIAFMLFAIVVWFAGESHFTRRIKKRDFIVESLGEEP